jgi:hypothetical protein
LFLFLICSQSFSFSYFFVLVGYLILIWFVLGNKIITQNELKQIRSATNINAPNAPTHVKMEMEIQPKGKNEEVQPAGGSLGVVVKV